MASFLRCALHHCGVAVPNGTIGAQAETRQVAYTATCLDHNSIKQLLQGRHGILHFLPDLGLLHAELA